MGNGRVEEKIDKIAFGAILLIMILSYLFTFPQGWLISDEYTYINAAMAICEGQSYLGYTDPVTQEYFDYKNSHYTYGNAFWIAIWAKILGIKYAYVGSLLVLIASMVLMKKTLEKTRLFVPTYGLLLLYPATLIFGHSLMSGMPSLGLCCLFLYILFSKEESRKKWFVLSFIAGLSFWFRETNVLLLGGLCLIHFLQDRRWFGFYALGTFLGFLPRLLSAWWAYDDPFYYILGETFSLASLANNLGLYAMLSLVFMPLGVLFFAVYKGRYRWPIVISVFSFLVLYLLYGYNAIAYSGTLTGTIVMSRFLLPILPFYIIAIAWFFKDKKVPKWLVIMFYIGVIGVSVVVQLYMHKEATIHKRASRIIYEQHSHDFVMLDHSGLTNIIRYANEFHGQFEKQTDISRLTDDEYMGKVFDLTDSVTILYTLNTVNMEKQAKTDKITTYIDHAKEKYTFVHSDTISIKGGLKVVRQKISQ